MLHHRFNAYDERLAEWESGQMVRFQTFAQLLDDYEIPVDKVFKGFVNNSLLCINNIGSYKRGGRGSKQVDKYVTMLNKRIKLSKETPND